MPSIYISNRSSGKTFDICISNWDNAHDFVTLREKETFSPWRGSDDRGYLIAIKSSYEIWVPYFTYTDCEFIMYDDWHVEVNGTQVKPAYRNF
ncbi:MULTISPECIES: hypothetical protein [Xenorhabdus]|uniref:hypothetical protein n=1 Tax=Xenorhabdus TaxID=626 RepID=UPI00064847E2|nr:MULTISPECIES: hypothetical protein [Xenorhabdus]